MRLSVNCKNVKIFNIRHRYSDCVTSTFKFGGNKIFTAITSANGIVFHSILQ